MPRKTSAVTKEQPKCHVHDKAGTWEVDEIRENVCVNDESLTEFEDKYFCLFHLPTKNKDIKKFKEIFRARLNAVEEKLKVIEELPEEKREESKREISYDFRYVWFPSDVDLQNYKFSANASFNETTFSANASFGLATFSTLASFSSTTFSALASFRSATFSALASFRSATFSTDAYFSSATFSAAAYFSSAKFTETSQIFFS